MVVDGDEVWKVWGVAREMRNEKRESTTCTCKKSQLAHTHTRTPSRT